jgi:hypothetical protein
VDGAESGNREGDDDALGNHRKVDDHPIAFDNAECGEGIGRLGDPFLQVGIGNHLAVTEFTLEIDRDAVTTTGHDVPVDTVDGDVERAANEPFCRRDRQFRFARCIRSSGRPGRRPGVGGVPALCPIQPVGLALPESERVSGGARPFGPVDVRCRREVSRGREDPCLAGKIFDRFGH